MADEDSKPKDQPTPEDQPKEEPKEQPKLAPVGAWRNPKRTASGIKDEQQKEKKPGWEYFAWRKQKEIGMAWDVDLIEWRELGGQLTPVALTQIEWPAVPVALTEVAAPVAVTEVSRVRWNYPVPASYFESVLERYCGRDHQDEPACYVAQKLGVFAYLIVYRENCEEFWVYCLTTKKGWKHFNSQQMADFLRSRKPKRA